MSPSIIIIFGCLGMFILAFGIVLFVIAYQKKVLANQNEMQAAENKFQNQLIEATLLTEQEEREKIAKNLHDDLGTSLNILRLNIEKLNRNTDKTDIVKKVSENSLEMIPVPSTFSAAVTVSVSSQFAWPAATASKTAIMIGSLMVLAEGNRSSGW